MSVFYDPDVFGDILQMHRDGAAVVDFVGILGAADKTGLDGYAVGVRRELRYAAGLVSLHDGDHLWLGTTQYTVRGEPELQNDGRELVVLLSEVRP